MVDPRYRVENPEHEEEYEWAVDVLDELEDYGDVEITWGPQKKQQDRWIGGGRLQESHNDRAMISFEVRDGSVKASISWCGEERGCPKEDLFDRQIDRTSPEEFTNLFVKRSIQFLQETS